MAKQSRGRAKRLTLPGLEVVQFRSNDTNCQSSCVVCRVHHNPTRQRGNVVRCFPSLTRRVVMCSLLGTRSPSETTTSKLQTSLGGSESSQASIPARGDRGTVHLQLQTPQTCYDSGCGRHLTVHQIFDRVQLTNHRSNRLIAAICPLGQAGLFLQDKA